MLRKTNGGFLISQIKQIQGRIFEKLLAEAEINEFNGSQGRILFVLWENDNIPITELSIKTGLAKTTLTSMLDRLESQGFLQRTYEKADRRKVFILLTDKARALKEKYETVSAQMNNIFYKSFSDKEIIDFEDYLKRILKNLQE